MTLDSIKDESGKYPAFAWPGGYPLIYICNDGEAACADCVNDASNAGWAFNATSDSRVIGADVYWEGPTIQCANCNADIDSAYGAPDTDSE